MLRPGNDGERLLPGTQIFRLSARTELSPEAIKRGTAKEVMFNLSSEDKDSPGKRLSVWVEELTIADQAWSIMGSKPNRNTVLCLNVDDVHSVLVPTGFSPLEVQWEKALRRDEGSNETTVDNRPGSKGHAGIAGLAQGGEGKTHKEYRKRIRTALADVAKVSPVPVPHKFEEEHLQVAAYFIFLELGSASASEEEHWVKAIRQLRRAEVVRLRSSDVDVVAGKL